MSKQDKKDKQREYTAVNLHDTEDENKSTNVEDFYQKSYGWDNIHKTAFLVDSKKLKEICDSSEKDPINSLTILSENALHILLENSTKDRSTLQICCQNGSKMTMCAIVNKEATTAHKYKKNNKDQNQKVADLHSEEKNDKENDSDKNDQIKISDQIVSKGDQENSDQKMDYNESDQVNVSDQKVTYKKISSQKNGDLNPKSGDRLELNQRKEDHKNEETVQSSQETANQKTYRLTETEDEVYKCAEILIQSKINVNHPNFWNETPIVLAIRYRRFKIVNLLLDVKDIDLDSCKDPISGKTPREMLMERNSDQGLVLPPIQQKHQNMLFNFLKSGNEEAFLKYNNGKISHLDNYWDGEDKDSPGCTLLQFCFRKSLILWHQENRLDFDLQHHQDIIENRMVQVFCENGMAKCIQHILENNVDVDKTHEKFQNNKTVLEAAIIKGFYPIVALILGQKDYKVETVMLLESLVLLIWIRLCNDNAEKEKNLNSHETLRKIVEKNKILCENKLIKIDIDDLTHTVSVVLNYLLRAEKPEEQDTKTDNVTPADKVTPADNVTPSDNVTPADNFFTPTDYFTLILNISVNILNNDNILLLLKFPKSLSNASTEVLVKISPDIIEEHLNDCLLQENDQVMINCESLLNDESMITIFEKLTSSEKLHKFLTHPVFKTLIAKHWQQPLLFNKKIPIFYLNFFFFLTFYLLLNAYIIYKFNNNDNCSKKFTTFVSIFSVIFCAREFFQCYASPKKYFKIKSNYLEMFLICLVVPVLALQLDWVNVVTILVSNSVLILHLFSVPKCAKYIIIWNTIVFYIKYILFYIIQLSAFAICFYILFAKKEQLFYEEIPNQFFNTIILFTGNLDYMNTPWTDDSMNGTTLYHDFKNKELFSKVIFMLFAICISVVLNNLLLGLLVVDINKLNDEASMFEQVNMTYFILKTEPFYKKLPKKFSRDDDLKLRENKYITVTNEFRTGIYRSDLQMTLKKKVKKINTLKKLKNYIKVKVNEKICNHN